MPSRAKPLWGLTVMLLVGAPVLNIVYWWQVLTSGVLPTDKDAVVPLMVAGVIAAGLVAPFILGLTWVCLRYYNPRTRLLAWREDRPVRSILATLIFGGMAAVFAVTLAITLIEGYPLQEYILVMLLPPGIVWLLAMRAAVIEQDQPRALPETVP
jgi:hypothetical protein